MRFDRAVVIGGSVAGLLAAAAAASQVGRVTIVERDELRDDAAPRKGVPQGSQIHVLLPIGEAMIEQLLPGLREELLAAGCCSYNLGASIPAYSRFGWRRRVLVERAQMVGYRRPLLELLIRRRVLALGKVELRRAGVGGLLASAGGGAVEGVLLEGGEEVRSELVVDAAGRGSKSPRWIEALGFEPPQQDEVRIYMGYATQFVRVPEGVLEADARGLGSMPTPTNPVGGIVMPADNGVHAVSAIGMLKCYPPGDRPGMLEFLERAESPLLAALARRSDPVSEVRTYRQPGNLRRRWEDLQRRPRGLIAVGDAVASFNPVHGQGITMAAHAATRLQSALADAATSSDAFPAAFQESLRAGLDVAFEMAAGSDAMYERSELVNFARPSAEEALYAERLEQLAVTDPEVVSALLEAGFQMRPEVLETDSIKAKVKGFTGLDEGGDRDPGAYPRAVHRLAVAVEAPSA